jgi:hypothetical protein
MVANDVGMNGDRETRGNRREFAPVAKTPIGTSRAGAEKPGLIMKKLSKSDEHFIFRLDSHCLPPTGNMGSMKLTTTQFDSRI